MQKAELIQLCDEVLSTLSKSSRKNISSFPNIPAGEGQNVIAMLIRHNLIDRSQSTSSVNNNPNVLRINEHGRAILIEHGSYSKYVTYLEQIEKETQNRVKANEDYAVRQTLAAERGVVWSARNTIIAFLGLLGLCFGLWQTFEVAQKNKIIEIQNKHIEQLRARIQ